LIRFLIYPSSFSAWLSIIFADLDVYFLVREHVPFYKSLYIEFVFQPYIFFIFNISIYFDKKKLIKELCLINLFIISSIFLSFKVYQIYLFYMKEYLFYSNDQQIYINGYVES